jgi:hypothetical protein
MKLFKCQSCGQSIYFENRFCENCGHALGYFPDRGLLTAVEPDGDDWIALTPRHPRVKFCANIKDDVCNWLIPVHQGERFCTACRFNRLIPDLSQENNLAYWRRMEFAKHRLFYTLLALQLPLKNRVDDPEHGLVFDFVADDPATSDATTLTGHNEGVIVINLNEADNAKREAIRSAMHEPYRTLLGHFRHEIGHYFWSILVRDGGDLDAFRAVFGDERADYGAALASYYATGAAEGWQSDFITAYATSHPWEDFAETWAHYLHIIDTLETASAFGLRIHPQDANDHTLHADITFDPHHGASMGPIIKAWLPLTFALNNLNRSMGQEDLYPFILTEKIVRKLQFIQNIIQRNQPVPMTHRRFR